MRTPICAAREQHPQRCVPAAAPGHGRGNDGRADEGAGVRKLRNESLQAAELGGGAHQPTGRDERQANSSFRNASAGDILPMDAPPTIPATSAAATASQRNCLGIVIYSPASGLE